jgi:hypothetical protein
VRRVKSSLSLRRIFEVQEQRAWHDVVTLDESWFYCATDYEPIGLPPGEQVSERPRVITQCKNLMVTIVWNPSGFHLIRVLPSGCKFNNSYCRREILEPLSEWRREQVGGAGRNLIVHANNAYPHTQRQHHKNSWRRTDQKEAFIHHTPRIWHPLTLISSTM